MPSMQDLATTPLAPDGNSAPAQQSQATNYSQGANEAIQTGINLATEQDKIQQSHAQLQQQQEQVEQAKFNRLQTYMQTLSRAPSGVASRLVKPMQDSLTKLGVDVDPTVLQLIASDDEHKRIVNQLVSSPAFSGIGSNPQARQAVMDGMQSAIGTGGGDWLGEATKLSETVSRIQAMQAQKNATLGIRQDALDERVHKNGITAISGDKLTDTLQSQYQAINNALTNYKAGGGMPQELANLETALRTNASGGQTGVQERADGYATTMGISAQKAYQFVTGHMTDADKSSPELVKAFENIAQAELENKQKQANAQINMKSQGFAHFYNRPGKDAYRTDFLNTVADRKANFGMHPDGTPMEVGSGTQAAALQAAPAQAPTAVAAQAPAPQGSPAAPQNMSVSFGPSAQVTAKIQQAAGAGYSQQDIEAKIGRKLTPTEAMTFNSVTKRK